MTINIFKKSALLLNERQGRWSTLFYFIFLFIGLFILSIYSSVSSNIISITVNDPSQTQFEQMYTQYSSKLSCPCTGLSTSYSLFMSIQPRFHQICSSQFIQDDGWLLYFIMTPSLNSTGDYGVYYLLDFRQSAGQSLFRLMKTLCQLANETITSAILAFNKSEYTSVESLSIEEFRIETSILMQQFQQQTLASFLSLLSLVRFSLENNHFYVSSVTNFAQSSFTINNSWALRYKPKTFYLLDNTTCTCLTSNSCTRPQGFYCTSSSCFLVTSKPIQTIPGFVVGCFPINSLLFSTLECLYNQSCIQMLLDWRLFDTYDWYQPILLNISALDSRLPSRYLPNTTLNEIVSNLMIEEWINTTNITAHYYQCAPHTCTYTYIDRSSKMHVITTIIGLSGGLSLVLRLIIPLIIKIIMQQLENHHQNQNEHPNNSISNQIYHRVRNVRLYVRHGYQAFVSLNMFQNRIDIPIFTTRLYLFVLTISFSIILLFTRLGQQTYSQTFLLPSQATFERLNDQYEAEGLSCPCSRNSIEYGSFLSLSVVYHQICSSSFIRADWWTLVAATGDTYALKDQPLLSAYFRMIASLCDLANQTINNGINGFISKTLVSIESLSRNSFKNQIESSINTFIQQTPIIFLHQLNFIIETFRSNQIQNMFMTTWKIEFTTAEENYLVASIPVSYNNDTCTCAALLSPKCWRSLIFVSNNLSTFTLPGLVAGCLPIDGLRQSTLECFFDSNCLNMFGMLVNNSMIPHILNISIPTRFPYMTTKFDSIIDELFVERWIYASNYSIYYETCAPHKCIYTFVALNNALYMITTLLGFYGGLTVVVQFVVLHTLLMLRKLRQWWLDKHINRVDTTVSH